MIVELDAAAVDGQEFTLSIAPGSPAVVAVETDDLPLHLSLLLGGRLRPAAGRVLVDGTADGDALRRRSGDHLASALMARGIDYVGNVEGSDVPLGGPADVVLCDMAANATGHRKTDHLRIMGLVEHTAEAGLQRVEHRRP